MTDTECSGWVNIRHLHVYTRSACVKEDTDTLPVLVANSGLSVSLKTSSRCRVLTVDPPSFSMASITVLLLAVTWSTTLAQPHSQVGSPCALMDCSPDYTCVERNNIGRCILSNTKPGECPMYKCAANTTLCSNHECDGDYGCPGTDKCCWQCDNCFRCLSSPDPPPVPRTVCGGQVCGSEETCVEIPVMCLIAPCSPIQRCVKTRCTLPVKTGRCKAAFRRYHYDYKTSTCKRFTFGGCDSNANNFRTEAQCRANCP